MAGRRATRRAVLAFIALAEAPMPYRVTFREYRREGERRMRHYLDLDCESEGELHTWARLLGFAPHLHRAQPYQPEGGPPKTMHDYDAEWRGWGVNIHTTVPVTQAELNEADRAALGQAATEEEEDTDGA